MNMRKLLGVGLIVLGAISLAYEGISYKSREEILRVGDFRATAVTKKTVPIPRYLGFGLLAGGVILLLTGRKKT
jgi:hypothetical protein